MNGGDRTVDSVSFVTAERFADLIGDGARGQMSLRLAGAVEADTRDLAKRPGLRRETHTPRRRESLASPLRGSGRRLEARVA